MADYVNCTVSSDEEGMKGMADRSASTFTLESILAFLDQIKRTFVNQPHKFTGFADIWTRYISDEIGLPEVLRRFGLLFGGHPELIVGFNNLLPPYFKLEDIQRHFLGIAQNKFLSSDWNIRRSSDCLCTKYDIVQEEPMKLEERNNIMDTAGIDHYMVFVTKVKRRYERQPAVFHKFLDILKAYVAKSEITCKSYSTKENVKKLLDNTLQEFGNLFHDDAELMKELQDFVYNTCERVTFPKETQNDNSAVDVIKYGSYKEFAFFDKVQHQMGNEVTFLNFMRCLQLYTSNMISGSELLSIIEPFTIKSPELTGHLKEMIKSKNDGFENVSHKTMANQKIRNPDISMEIDYSSCKKQGVSYRALPPNLKQPLCSSRTDLCNEVLNDTWVSFPSWSEDTTFGNSRITAYQEFLYRCEDERFELQIVIDSVSSTIQILEEVCEKISQMSPEEMLNFKLDDRLGGTSEVLQKKAIQRIYGDKANEIIEGLKQKPCIAVPIALRRLKAKTQEWKEHQDRFNKCWKELNVKNYQKALYNDASTFKQNDTREMRTKALLNEAEAIYEENQEQSLLNIHKLKGQPFLYSDKQILGDASLLMVHYLSHFPTVQNDDGFLISQLLVELLPSLLYIPSIDFTKGESHMKAEPDLINQMDEVYTLVFMNSSWYLFIRLHHKLCKRLLEIRTHCRKMQLNAVHSDLVTPNGMKATSLYDYVLLMTKCLIEGLIENSAFEDELRATFETFACITFTLDKLLQHIMRQLQHIISDEICKDLMFLFHKEKMSGGAGGRVSTSHQRAAHEMSYQRKAYQMLAEDYCFKIIFYKYQGLVTMELVDTEGVPADDPQEVELWTKYIDQFVSSDTVEMSVIQKPVFLKRNLQDRLHTTNCLKTPRVVSIDNTQCHFNTNSLKIQFTVDSWDYFRICSAIKTHAPHKKKFGSVYKHQKFTKWWNRWKTSNVSNDQEKRFREWMVGQKPGRAKNRQPNDHSIMPHRQCKKLGGVKH